MVDHFGKLPAVIDTLNQLASEFHALNTHTHTHTHSTLASAAVYLMAFLYSIAMVFHCSCSMLGLDKPTQDASGVRDSAITISVY